MFPLKNVVKLRVPVLQNIIKNQFRSVHVAITMKRNNWILKSYDIIMYTKAA